MTVPITSPTPGSRLAGARRDVEVLKRRVCGPWVYVGTAGVDGIDALLTALSPPFVNGWGNQGGGKVPARFRWRLGGGFDIEMSVTGGTANATIFTLPTGFFDPAYEVPGHGHDNTGAYRAYHITTAGDVVDGV